MRTVVRLDADVAAAVEQLRRERHLGLSDAVNSLARAGMQHGSGAKRPRARFPSAHIGSRVDVSNVAEVLDQLDAEDRSSAAGP
jgi:hypothetical protein